MSAYDLVTDRLRDRTNYDGRNGMWRCPAHDDHNPSLKVSQGDKGAVLHCHAGCDVSDVLDALGLEPADLFDQPRGNGQERRELVATYRYADEEGTVLFEVVKYRPKDFRQRRPDGSWGIQGVRRVLYQLPAVLAAVAEGRPVYVVEGEKDVHALEREGVTATTNPMGAGNWRSEHTMTLSGHPDVRVVADKDDKGRAHARHVTRELRSADCGVTLLQPRAKDVADHLGMGFGLDDLEPLAGEDDNHGALRDGYRPTDAGNADRFLKLADGQVRYVHKWGRWLVYKGGRWIVDANDALVTELAKQVARQLFKVAVEIEGDKDERERTWRQAIRCESDHAIRSMLRLARGHGDVLVDHEELDTDPCLLNVQNGTIDLRTGELRPSDPADLITQQCPVAYDPSARSELWEQCLRRWQPEQEMRDYLQLRAGASATGLHTETLDVDHGDGGNGKSKFHDAIRHALGDHAAVPHKSLLTAGRWEQHPTEVAKLFRKRVAIASETSADSALNDEQVKNLTGGDRLAGRRMREDPWEFQPTHTLIMFANHKPAIRGRDYGIWRRVRLVPWEVTIPPEEVDTNLGAKLRDQAPAVLAWIVEGARRFLAEGLEPPERVKVATAAYRAEEDIVGRFLADVLEFGKGFAFSTEIKAELGAWCHEQGVTEPRMNEIAVALLENSARKGGRKVIKGQKCTVWYDVMIRETAS